MWYYGIERLVQLCFLIMQSFIFFFSFHLTAIQLHVYVLYLYTVLNQSDNANVHLCSYHTMGISREPTPGRQTCIYQNDHELSFMNTLSGFDVTSFDKGYNTGMYNHPHTLYIAIQEVSCEIMT